MGSWIAVFLGGGLGSVCRYFLSVYNPSSFEGFPFGTFMANAISCLLLGILSYFILEKELNKNLALLLATGFCGGFSTFSTFALENFKLLQNNNYSTFVFYVIGSLFVGVLAILVGYFLSKNLAA